MDSGEQGGTRAGQREGSSSVTPEQGQAKDATMLVVSLNKASDTHSGTEPQAPFRYWRKKEGGMQIGLSKVSLREAKRRQPPRGNACPRRKGCPEPEAPGEKSCVRGRAGRDAGARRTLPGAAAARPAGLRLGAARRLPGPLRVLRAGQDGEVREQEPDGGAPDLPPYVRSLFITGNPLTDLPAGAFLAQRLPDLASLNLSGNHLRTVEAGSLALPALRQLDLSGNALVSFSPQAFGEGGSPLEELALRGALRDHGVLLSLAALLQSGALRNLSRLELADNGLLLLPAGMFTALPALRQLDLSNNSLVGLRNVSFQGLGQLQSLNLSDNSLGVLWNGTLAQFRSLPTLRHIVLGRNAWVCDCAIEDLVAWLKESDQVEGKEALTCASPDKMLGRAC
ncbi:hypothetical protein DUI87_10846 [Hirundo rustica rustica]|uniref:LRRCT domain-containing protein n=1 Tax=Hirundo rustica rustica TaxID=333673 RepID=A0A3M0KKZ5_HIRRU|nr:hypothetical protein DUI87_10846 [Hirundo rustica rustica]